MKTVILKYNIHSRIQITILVLAFSVFCGNTFAMVANIADIPAPVAESYINDIPFDTHEIAIGYFFEQAMAGIEMPVDTDARDIPFNTEIILQLNLMNRKTVLPTLAPEKYVNDIPFDTHCIAQDFLFTSLNNKLCLRAEQSVNDIPFETATVLAQLDQPQKPPMQFSLLRNIPDHLLYRISNLLKAGLVSMIILLCAGLLGILFFSYVY